MFAFMHRSTVRRLSRAMRRALEKDDLVPGIGSLALLRIVELKGRFSDRKVTHIRIFDPLRAEEHALVVRRFRDLDDCPRLILHAGHIETNGSMR